MKKMRKFKLIKDLPDANSGTILEWNSSENCYKAEKSIWVSPYRYLSFSKGTVEESPEWFEEIKEEYPKIISFRKKFGNREVYKVNESGVFTDYKESFGYNYLLEHHLFEIYQVATSSDTIFTVGDKVYWNWADARGAKYFTIKSFYYKDNNLVFDTIEDSAQAFGFYINLKHYKAPTPLFVTEDGKELYSNNDIVYGALPKNMWQVNINGVNLGRLLNAGISKTSWKWFSTPEAATKFSEDNKPRFSKKQVEEALEYGHYAEYSQGRWILKEKVKQKLGI